MKVLSTPQVVVDGLNLPECPRWRDGALYFSDITRGRVYRLNANDETELLYQSPSDFVGGIGFTAEGDLIAVLSKQRQVARVGEDGAPPYADLTSVCRFVLNDMVVTDARAYVSQPGMNIWEEEAQGMPPATDLLVAEADGRVAIAASEMMSPNGMAVSPDGRTLYVAESTAMRISRFAIDPATGSLSDRAVFATLPDGGIPDGICLDSEGGVWAASPVAWTPTSFGAGPGVYRLTEGGVATHLVPVEKGRRALACAFGGEDRKSLFICTVPDFEGSAAGSAGQGRIERVSLDFSGAGVP
jgi:sugar lactone lactonase YvrE